MEFFSDLSLSAPMAELTLRGELDAFAARQLRCRLDEAVDRGCLVFLVDASAVTFLDAGGLGMFVWLSNTVRPYGGYVSVVAASRRVQQVATLAGLGGEFGFDLLADTVSDSPVGGRGGGGRLGRSSRRVVSPRAGDCLPITSTG
jgi:anti-sigma B factor antagonist